MRAIVAILLTALTCGNAVAREPAPAARPAPAAAPPAAEPVREAMTFRLVEGLGPAGQTRWIAASGRIGRDSVEAFKRFLAGNKGRTQGLTVYLDSFGGLVGSSLVLGREIRAAGLKTGVGRTIVLAGEPRRHALVTHGVSCNSACVYALMGGVERIVEPSVRLGVHQFSGRLNSEGTQTEPTFGVDDFRFAQRQMAAIAVYLQEMGIDQKLLPMIASVPYGGPLLTLRRADIAGTGLAALAAAPAEAPGAFGWTLFDRADDPSLHRRLIRTDRGRRIADDIMLRCGREGRASLQWHQAALEARDDAQTIPWSGGQLLAGGERQALTTIRAASGLQNGPRPSLWIAAPLEAATLKAMVASGGFEIERIGAEGGERRLSLGDAGFAAAVKRFAAACAARPGLQPATQPDAPGEPDDRR